MDLHRLKNGYDAGIDAVARVSVRESNRDYE